MKLSQYIFAMPFQQFMTKSCSKSKAVLDKFRWNVNSTMSRITMYL